MLLVQNFLKNKTFGDLYKEHGVSATLDSSGALLSLNYDMLDAKDKDKLAQQCRGLILAKSNGASLFNEPGFKRENDRNKLEDVCPGETVIVSYPFNRFFNQGQDAAADVDWNDPSLQVQLKLDGSLIHLSFNQFKNEWFVSTKSVPCAPQFVDEDKTFTFASLFNKAFKETTGIDLSDYTKTLDKDYTYIFELMTPLNQVVVLSEQYKVSLIGIRNKVTFQETPVRNYVGPVPVVKSFSLNNLNDVMALVLSYKPTDNEGVVVVDSQFNRIKVKHPEYSSINRARDSLIKSNRACVSLILNGLEDDVIVLMPKEVQDKIVDMKEKISNLIKNFKESYDRYYKEAYSYPMSDGVRRKTFAGLVKTNEKWSDPFFALFSNKAKDIKEYIEKKKVNHEFNDSFLDGMLEMIGY